MRLVSQLQSNVQLMARSGLAACFGAGILFWASMAAQLPTMPLYLRSLNTPATQVGWVMGAFAIGLLCSRTYLGRLSDRRGRCLVMRVGLVVAAVVPAFYAVNQAIPILMGLRAIHGISIAAFATGYSALVADLAPPAQRGRVIGYMSLVNPMGMALGPVLGDWLQFEFGYPVMFRVAGSLALVGLLVSWGIRDAVLDLDLPAIKPEFWSTFLSERVWVPAFTLFMVGLSFGTLSAFLPLLIKETQVNLSVGLFYLVTAIAGFTVRVMISRLSDRVGRGLFINLGLVFYGLSMVLIFFATSPMQFLLAAFSEGMGAGLVIPAIITMLADRTVVTERGFVLGLVLMGFDLGIACAGPTMGSLMQHTSLGMGFLAATGLLGLAILVFSTHSNLGLANSLRFAIGRGQDCWAIAAK
ncbi:MAG: MFS transporter [Pseudanabaenaceae cyanobacterium bins.68]|nr:MFS transporter [Pseudanabaenaceae cyanobacterium bins.68]